MLNHRRILDFICKDLLATDFTDFTDFSHTKPQRHREQAYQGARYPPAGIVLSVRRGVQLNARTRTHIVRRADFHCSCLPAILLGGLWRLTAMNVFSFVPFRDCNCYSHFVKHSFPPVRLCPSCGASEPFFLDPFDFVSGSETPCLPAGR
jgi:hypothetical protein